MNAEPTTPAVRHRGTWWQRFLILLLSLLLTALIYWLLGFILNDISDIAGPAYNDVETELIDPELISTQKRLAKEITDVDREINNQQHRQRLLRDSTQSARTTLTQLIEIRRLSLQRGTALTDEQQEAFVQAQQLFLENQRRDQELSESLAGLNEQRVELLEQQRQHEEKLQKAREPIQKEFELRYRRHNLRIAAIKIATLAPLLLIGAWLFIRRRDSVFAPLIYAFDVAVLLRTFEVMHEHFPSAYFKYILIIAVLVAVAWVLGLLLRRVATPSRDWRLAQYREAYETFFCPVCRFPIRRGPLKYLSWTARSLRKLAPSGDANQAARDEAYTCPSCATVLFEKCGQCDHVRHALLPACEHCGNAKEI
jgi:hypothetical protein